MDPEGNRHPPTLGGTEAQTWTSFSLLHRDFQAPVSRISSHLTRPFLRLPHRTPAEADVCPTVANSRLPLVGTAERDPLLQVQFQV